MKVLIVDDEKHVRDAIKLLVDWQRFPIERILEAADGQAAIEVIEREKPEILFTDMMMPVKNGVELLEWLHAHTPECKTIVISGHDDFALVRHTVQYGGTDYILKPIDAEQLNAALNKAISAWTKEQEERNRGLRLHMEINQIKPVYWDKRLSELLNDSSQFAPVKERLEQEFGLPKQVNECQVALVSLDTMDKTLKDKFGNNRDLLAFSLINICNEFLRKAERGVAFRNWNGENEIVLLMWKRLEQTKLLLSDINEGMLSTLRSRLDFGLGSVHPFPQGLGSSYREAQTALRRRNLLQKETWIHTASDDQRPGRVLHFSDYEENIRLAVKSGSSEQIHAALQVWFEAVRSLESITLEQLDLWHHEYSVLRTRWVEDFFPDPEGKPDNFALPDEAKPLAVTLDEQGRFSIARWEQEFARSMIRLSQLLLEHRQKNKNIIFEIAKYIETHYKEDISLQDISGRFFLSREYISRKFKQEFGVNLSDFLVRIRIEKAKLLLLNPHLRVAEIAESVGYNDEKYFSKVFKKATGFSPAEYRKHAH